MTVGPNAEQSLKSKMTLTGRNVYFGDWPCNDIFERYVLGFQRFEFNVDLVDLSRLQCTKSHSPLIQKGCIERLNTEIL